MVEYRLVIRDSTTLSVVALFSCLDRISTIKWAPDSLRVLCFMKERAMCQVFDISEPDWTAKIEDRAAGIATAIWAPDARHVITIAEFAVRLTAWSLNSKAVTHINAPKSTSPKCVTFNPTGTHMALAERRDCKDYVTVFSVATWEPIKHFAVSTVDLASLHWSPDGSAIAICDHALDYKLVVYSPDGKQVADYVAYENGMGIRSASWSPSGQMLAVGSYDGVCRVLNHITWKPFAEWAHAEEEVGSGGQSVLREPDGVVVYRETNAPDADGGVAYVVDELPVGIPTIKPAMDKPNPKVGVCSISFSGDGSYAMTRSEHMPCAAWIWDMKTLELASVLIQRQPITSASWDASLPRVLLTTTPGGGPDAPRAVFMWTPDGASCIPVPNAGFSPGSVAWCPALETEESSFVLCDSSGTSFCCGYVAA